MKKVCIFLCVFSCYNSITAMEEERPSAFRDVRDRTESPCELTPDAQRAPKKPKTTFTFRPWPPMVSQPFGSTASCAKPTQKQPSPTEEEQVLCPKIYLGPEFKKAYTTLRDEKGILRCQSDPSLTFETRTSLLKHLLWESKAICCPVSGCSSHFTAHKPLERHMRKTHPEEPIPAGKILVPQKTIKQIRHTKYRAYAHDTSSQISAGPYIWTEIHPEKP